ncbi:hypothetical protein PULV_a0069 [Pseudoalteromonas ulvae UL12]|uniref:Uncharacterized protein n=1 Tax=Pseudoalteromonas ulvae TaxID=107327 RepID=A0A244CV70_PSEDV|nr:hypothetical protein [Pseudoalteromonas ulvae]MBE0362555.1 hypothetical protein [Pseudoalteromonas ulvae UL12]OUL59488.1 hypothetical protein B1199_04260 [Pseudoalteromonas ulvae]
MQDVTYFKMNALSSEHYHQCFYCGCLATELDYVPPKQYVKDYQLDQDDGDFYAVPSCLECVSLLKKNHAAYVTLRRDKLKQLLAQKYQRAIHVYQVWQEDEIEELDYHLAKSIAAGLILGKESLERVEFSGFSYEVDGHKHHVLPEAKLAIKVDDRVFYTTKEALDYANKTYRIPKATLIDLLEIYNDDYNQAIYRFGQMQLEKEHDKALKKQCGDFAKQHKQNTKFVIRTVEYYLNEDEEMTIQQALEKLLTERLS